MMRMETAAPYQTTSSSLSSREVGCDSSKKFSHWTCFQCGVTSTPVRRSGPYGQSTLCNACGLRLSKLKKMYSGILHPSNYQKHWERLQKRAKLSKNIQKRAAKTASYENMDLGGIAIDNSKISPFQEEASVPPQNCLYWNNEKVNGLLSSPPYRGQLIQEPESNRFPSLQFPNSTVSFERYPSLYEDYTAESGYALPSFEDVNSQLEEFIIPSDYLDAALEFTLDSDGFPNGCDNLINEEMFDLENRYWDSRCQRV